jgi:ribonuclease HI/uncharacterized phage-like protein YoqJ
MGTIVYTDGACLGNPGPGGWSWVVPEGRFASGAEAQTTNQRMEITAAIEALRAIDGPLEVVSDSTYVVNCFRDRWWEGWLARGWVNSRKQPVANRDLWEQLIELYRAHPQVTFRWVKGHSGDPWNDLADRLAVEAARTQRGRSGDRPPEEVGAPDESGDRPGDRPADRPGDRPEGHLVAVLGHRPPELGGYDPNPTATAVRRRVGDILEAQRQLHPDLALLTGLNLGAEQLAAEAAVERDIPIVAVQPFPDPDARWPDRSRAHYRELLDAARDVVLLQRKPVDGPQKVRGAMARRDAWLAQNADQAIVVWDGEDERLRKTARTLEDHLGDDVWIVDPAELA